MIYSFLISSISVFAFTIAIYFDTRTPMSSKLKYKYRVKDDSILRKILPFTDRHTYPCNYFKVVPIYVYLVITVLGMILSLIEWISKGWLSKMMPEGLLVFAPIAVIYLYFVYLLAISIWWGIIDHQETKFTEEQKAELTALRKQVSAERKHQKK